MFVAANVFHGSQRFQFVKDLLCAEDFPMAEQCQRGLATGRDRVVIGRNEPLLQHLHQAWADGMRDPGVQSSPVSLAAARG